MNKGLIRLTLALGLAAALGACGGETPPPTDGKTTPPTPAVTPSTKPPTPGKTEAPKPTEAPKTETPTKKTP